MKHALNKAKIRAAASLMLLVLLVPRLSAQVTKVRDLNLDTHRDRRVLFDMTVTPKKEILSFVAKETGEWELYRVSDWLDQKPTIKRLFVPGFFSKRDSKRDGKPMETLDAKVIATRDGKYAVCIGSAMWLKRVRGRAVGQMTMDNVIAVVDLSSLKIVATTHTSDLNIFANSDVTLDDDGFLRVDSLSPDRERSQGAFIRLSVPSLKAGPKCAYNWVVDSPGKEHPQATTIKECGEILKSQSLADYLAEEVPRFSTVQFKVCQNNHSEFCRWPGEFTADGRLGVAVRSEGHDNFWGWWVTTGNSYIVFSKSRGADIGGIKEPTNDSFRSSLTSVGGHDYFLVLQSGTHLAVYELQDHSSAAN